MSDLKTFRAMLATAGIVFTEQVVQQADQYTRAGDVVVRIRVRDQQADFGYLGFFTDAVFGPDGALLKIGAWE